MCSLGLTDHRWKVQRLWALGCSAPALVRRFWYVSGGLAGAFSGCARVTAVVTGGFTAYKAWLDATVTIIRYSCLRNAVEVRGHLHRAGRQTPVVRRSGCFPDRVGAGTGVRAAGGFDASQGDEHDQDDVWNGPDRCLRHGFKRFRAVHRPQHRDCPLRPSVRFGRDDDFGAHRG